MGPPVLAEAARRGWQITDIWNTHWHPDHTGANLEIKEATGASITGPAAESGKIPGIDRTAKEGYQVTLSSVDARVIEVPVQTARHIAYHLAYDADLYRGDTRFAMGTGPLLGGPPHETL